MRFWAAIVLWLVTGSACVAALGRSAASVGHLEAQIHRMHAMAIRHRAYEAPGRWRHDENVLVRAVAEKRSDCLLPTVGLSISVAALAFVLLRRFREQRSLNVVVPARVGPPNHGRRLPVIGMTEAPRFAYPFADALRKREGETIETRLQRGAEGEDIVHDALRPLLADGWTLLARNFPATLSRGRTTVDIDFVVRSPDGIGFCIDAKNVRAKVTYRPGNRRLEHVVEFRYNQFEARPKRVPIAMALESADFAKAHAAFAFPADAKMHAVMCFVENDRLDLSERYAYGLHLTRASNLADLLREINRKSRGGGTNETPAERRADA